jgi:hypothetical protein
MKAMLPIILAACLLGGCVTNPGPRNVKEARTKVVAALPPQWKLLPFQGNPEFYATHVAPTELGVGWPRRNSYSLKESPADLQRLTTIQQNNFTP